MTVDTFQEIEVEIGAPSHPIMDWSEIDWQKVQEEVRRLQARIVKATQEGRWGKVKALQHLLTHSFSGKALAVRRVTENQGKRTPGVDRITWDTPEQKTRAVRAMRQWGYHPQPLRRVYIPKSNGKMRPLGIPTMADRAMQALYLLALDPIAETTGDPNSYGFRPSRSAADASVQCFTALAQKGAAQWILEGDIKSCFDKISHSWLLENVPMDKAILQSWLKAGFLENQVVYPTEEGTPQGGIISPVLANLTLDGLEKTLREKYPLRSKAIQKAQVYFVRYADDFVITGSSKELLEATIKPIVEQFMSERGLELSVEKTAITHIDDGFDFLGFNVRKYGGKLLIKPSKKSISHILTKTREVIKNNKALTPGKLIVQLNPILRGWANYHRHEVAKAVFARIDSGVFWAVWRWAKRRHPNKGRHWIRRKYFRSKDFRNWVFHGTVDGPGGKPKEVELFSLARVPITRHVKIRGEANPYDPEWETYFEERLGVQMEANLKGRRKLLRLWVEQNGICPVCKQKITKLTGWHNHHIVWRSYGGSDGAQNRVLLHPTCHTQVHSQGLNVVKPRPAKGVWKA